MYGFHLKVQCGTYHQTYLIPPHNVAYSSSTPFSGCLFPAWTMEITILYSPKINYEKIPFLDIKI
jgi:hypothetical protein